MKRTTGFLFTIMILMIMVNQGCKMNGTNADSIDSLFHEYHEETLKMNPLNATALGDNRYNDTMPNYLTVEFRELQRSVLNKYKDRLAKYNRDKLTPNQQMSYDILEWRCNNSLEALEYPTYLLPIDQFWSTNLTIGTLAGGTGNQPFKTVEDYNNWLKRVDDYMAWCDTAMANMRKGMKMNFVLPKSLIKKVIPQMQQFAEGPVENHVFYGPVKIMPKEFSNEEKVRIKKLYAEMVEMKVILKYKEIQSFLENEYLPAGRESSGYLGLPGMEGYYEHMIRSFTTTDMTPEEVFELGKSEVERITAEMNRVKDSLGFEGDLESFFSYIRTKKELMPFTEPEQVIDHFNAIHAKMQPQLEKLFDIVPKTPFEVRRVEAFREKSASAQYNSGSFDGSRPGIFYVPIPDVKHYNIFSDEDLFLHEAIPGHHFQISLQQENTEIPEFRKLFWNSSFGEGWCLYCESLGTELGLYTDPYQYFGMLSAEMHRAIRMVVDVGIHVKGWTREEAIQYSLDHEAEPEESVVAEIERYMALPGQAISYKIGQLKILELRAKAEKGLGDKFNIKEFHNELLDAGCPPIFLVEKKINNWIESKLKAEEI